MTRALAVAVLVAGCGQSTELSLAIRLPADRHLLAAVARLNLIATRDNNVLAQSSFAGNASYVSLSGVAHGPDTVLTLDGLSAAGDVVARGRTCPIDFQHGGTVAPLYYAPTNFFAPTVNQPAATRIEPIAVPLSDGTVLLAGGDAAAELFLPGGGTFAATTLTLSVPRDGAQAVQVPGIGALVTGGTDTQTRQPVARAELFDQTQRQFLSLPDDPRLGARVGHRALLVDNRGTVLITGGQSPPAASALGSTVSVRVQAGGTAVVSTGPPLATARYQHATVVASGVPVVIGGYAADGTPLASVEALVPASDTQPASFVQIASLRFARAEATASLLGDGSILVVGGAGDAKGTPRADAELFNTVTRTTQVLQLAFGRRGHSATVLPDGRVLIAGGVDAANQPLSSVELFVPAAGDFVSERPLATPRANHVAVPLCDGTVLVVGGAPGAELYTPPAS